MFRHICNVRQLQYITGMDRKFLVLSASRTKMISKDCLPQILTDFVKPMAGTFVWGTTSTLCRYIEEVAFIISSYHQTILELFILRISASRLRANGHFLICHYFQRKFLPLRTSYLWNVSVPFSNCTLASLVSVERMFNLESKMCATWHCHHLMISPLVRWWRNAAEYFLTAQCGRIASDAWVSRAYEIWWNIRSLLHVIIPKLLLAGFSKKTDIVPEYLVVSNWDLGTCNKTK